MSMHANYTGWALNVCFGYAPGDTCGNGERVHAYKSWNNIFPERKVLERKFVQY